MSITEGIPTAGGSPFRPSKICRRWSLDNLSPDSRREGYVRDLRARHKANQQQRNDEGYPFMLTESRQKNYSSSSHSSGLSSSSNGGSRPGSASPPPTCSFTPIPHPPPTSAGVMGKRGRSFSLDEEPSTVGPGTTTLGHLMAALSRGGSGNRRLFRGGSMRLSSVNGCSTSSLDVINVVPEDNELEVTVVSTCSSSHLKSAPPTTRASPEPQRLAGHTPEYLRKRSSSLPRILPPIIDDDSEVEEDLEFGQELLNNSGNRSNHADLHTSNIIAREMQKFVCRHASDVSQVLPLPLPTSFRQSRLLNSSGEQQQLLLDTQHVKLLLSSLAKIHAVSYAIKCKTPRLFDEINGSLAAPGAPAAAVQHGSWEDAAAAVLSQAAAPTHVRESLVRQVRDLTNCFGAVPFSVLVHGDVARGPSFRYNGGGSDVPVAVSLPGLASGHAMVASPLVDIYGVLYGCSSDGGVVSPTTNKEGLLFAYHSSFIEVCNLMRVQCPDFSRERLEADLERFDVAGLVLTTAMMAAASDKTAAGSSCGRLRSLLDVRIEDLSQKLASNLNIRDR